MNFFVRLWFAIQFSFCLRFIILFGHSGALCIYALILVVVCRAIINGESNRSDSEADAIVV